MTQRLATVSLLRFWSGLTLGALNGYVVFREEVFRPDRPAFDCLTVGALLAGTLTLVRLARHSHAVVLALFYGAFKLLSPGGRWSDAVAGLLLGLGVFLVSVIYDELARFGLRFGKFLIVGPLLGGAYLAVGPLTGWSEMTVFNASYVLVYEIALGIVIGEGVGFGVEIAELVSGVRSPRPVVSRPSTSGADPRGATSTVPPSQRDVEM